MFAIIKVLASYQCYCLAEFKTVERLVWREDATRYDHSPKAGELKSKQHPMTGISASAYIHLNVFEGVLSNPSPPRSGVTIWHFTGGGLPLLGLFPKPWKAGEKHHNTMICH